MGAGTSPGIVDADHHTSPGTCRGKGMHGTSGLCFQLGGVVGERPGMSRRKVTLGRFKWTGLAPLFILALLRPQKKKKKASAGPGRGTAAWAHRVRRPW